MFWDRKLKLWPASTPTRIQAKDKDGIHWKPFVDDTESTFCSFCDKRINHGWAREDGYKIVCEERCIEWQ